MSMSKKLSGAENRKRRARKEIEFEKSKKSMNLEKYLTDVTNEKDVNVDASVPVIVSSSDLTLSAESIQSNSAVDDRLSKESASSVSSKLEVESVQATEAECGIDFSDPATWNKTNKKILDYLIKNGLPKCELRSFPKDDKGRHFAQNHFSRNLPNGELVFRRWLVYSESLNKIYCFCCFYFDIHGKSSLANNGFSDWKHVSQIIKEHENTSNHAKSYLQWIEAERLLKNEKSIDKIEQKMILREAEHWNNVLKRLMGIILYLAQNNLALRGNSDKLFTPNNGKYLSLIELFAQFDPVMQEHINRILRGEVKDHYCGKNIANEFLALMAERVKLDILSRIKNSKYYSIIADCTPDVSHYEQLSLIVRYVDISGEKVEICESFLGFVIATDSTGTGLSETILNILIESGLDLINCRGQGYDNGANMKGKKNGVQQKILNKNPLAAFIPCGCHSLNLVLCDAAKSSLDSVNLFGILGRIYTIFALSVKRWEILLNHVKSFTVKRLSDTRWEARIDCVKAIRYQIADIHDALVTLAEIEKTHDHEVSHEALSLCEKLMDFKFLVSLVVWYDILFQINIVSKMLQNEKIDLSLCVKLIENCYNYFVAYRVNGFNSAITNAKELAIELGIDPVFKNTKRIRRVKRQFEYESCDEPVETHEKKFETEFFNTLLDVVLVSLQERFIQLKEHTKIWGFLYNIKEVLSSEKELLENCNNLQSHLTIDTQCDIQGSELCNEILNLKSLLPEEQNNSPIEILNFMKLNKLEELFSNLWIALRILITKPVTVASGERSFSKLKLIKNYLRSSMNQDRLNNLAILSIENDIARKINFDDVITKFSHVKARKINFK